MRKNLKFKHKIKFIIKIHNIKYLSKIKIYNKIFNNIKINA